MMNATAIAFDRAGTDVCLLALRWRSLSRRAERHDDHLRGRHGRGYRHCIRPRSKIFTSATATEPSSRSGATSRSSCLPRSNSAYPLITSRSVRSGDLFVTGPNDRVFKIDPNGTVTTFYKGLGRPQGLAFDVDGNLYVAASLSGTRGIVKIAPNGMANLEVAGQGLVGLAFAPGRSVILATTGAVPSLSWNIPGLRLTPAVAQNNLFAVPYPELSGRRTLLSLSFTAGERSCFRRESEPTLCPPHPLVRF